MPLVQSQPPDYRFYKDKPRVKLLMIKQLKIKPFDIEVRYFWFLNHLIYGADLINLEKPNAHRPEKSPDGGIDNPVVRPL